MDAVSTLVAKEHNRKSFKNDHPHAPYYLKLAKKVQVSINRVLVPSELASIQNSKFYRMFLEG